MTASAQQTSRWLASVDITVEPTGRIVPVISDCRNSLLDGGQAAFNEALANQLIEAAEQLRAAAQSIKSSAARGK